MKRVVLLIMTLLVALCACTPTTPPDVIPPDEPDNPTPPHECASVCEVCGKCANAACGESACEEKCGGHKTIEEIQNYSLWSGDEENTYRGYTLRDYIEKSVVLDCEEAYGGKYFVHGIAIEHFVRDGKEILVATWAYNPVAENTPGEQAHYSFSYDDGKTWTAPKEIKSNDADYSASHGVMWYYEDTLYAMIPVVKFEKSPWTIKCELSTYNFETEEWEYQGVCCAGFWPTSKPVKLDTGDWIVAGPVLSKSGRAKTQGDDFTKWRVYSNAMGENNYKFSESGMAVNGNMVVIIGRNDTVASVDSLGVDTEEGRYELAVCVSYDYGDSFTKMDLSGVYSSPSKAMCGTLSNGRFYMIWNMDTTNIHSRRRLLLGIGDVDSGSIDTLYVLDNYDGGISYPYATEANGYLYIVYSQSIANRVNGNQNDLILVKLPISALED